MIERKSLAQQMATALKGQIEDGQYKPGDKLPIEAELSRLFGVGRGTVREGVRILAAEGRLSIRQGSGTYVCEPIAQKAVDMARTGRIYLEEMRYILEEPIARLASERRTPIDIERLHRLLEQRGEYANSGETQKCGEADIMFHSALADATHNPLLADVYRKASETLQRSFSNYYNTTEEYAASQKSHENLLKAVESGDAAKAGEIAKIIIEEP